MTEPLYSTAMLVECLRQAEANRTSLVRQLVSGTPRSQPMPYQEFVQPDPITRIRLYGARLF